MFLWLKDSIGKISLHFQSIRKEYSDSSDGESTQKDPLGLLSYFRASLPGSINNAVKWKPKVLGPTSSRGQHRPQLGARFPSIEHQMQNHPKPINQPINQYLQSRQVRGRQQPCLPSSVMTALKRGIHKKPERNISFRASKINSSAIDSQLMNWQPSVSTVNEFLVQGAEFTFCASQSLGDACSCSERSIELGQTPVD